MQVTHIFTNIIGSYGGSSSGGGSGMTMSVLGLDITRFLLPLAAISLVALPTLASLTGNPYASIIFPNIFGKRKKRSVPFRHDKGLREMKVDQEIEILEDFWEQQPLKDRKDQMDMIMANYVTCSGLEGTVFDEITEHASENHCLEHIACLYGNQQSPLSNAERNVVAV